MAQYHGISRKQMTPTAKRSLLNGFFSALIYSLLVLLLSASTARAVRFDVFVGFNGAVPEGNWFPIACEVQNDGPSFNGVIEVAGAFGASQARRIPLELTTGATKRVVIPAFSSSRYSTWTARLLDGRGKVVAEQNVARESIRNVAWGTPFIAALSRTIGGQPILPQPKNKNQPEQVPIVTRLQTALFPDNPIALEGLGTLYLNSATALELKMPQIQALLAWIDGGGHLILGVEEAADVNATPWLKGLLPCQLNSTVTVKPAEHFDALLRQTAKSTDSSERTTKTSKTKKASKAKPAVVETVAYVPDTTFNNSDLPIVGATVEGDGEVVLSVGSHPLAIQRAQGRGHVTALTFSPEREPFLSWKNRTWFWANLAEIPAKFFENSDYASFGGWSADGLFGAIVDSKQVRKLPLTWLLLLLLVYLVIIGPFDRWWLKKINRQMLTWITFPTYVICFSILIYFIGFKLRAGDSEWNEVHVVDILAQGEKAVLRGRTFASIYSPSNARYNLASEQPFATLRGEYRANNYGNGQENSQASIIQRGNNFEADVSVPVWTSQLYISDWLQAAENPLRMETLLTGTNLQVNVFNKMDRPLKSLSLIFNTRVYTIGDMPAGEKKFSLNLNAGTALKEFVRDHGNSLRDAAQQRNNTFGDTRPQIKDVALGAMAVSFLSQMNDQGNAYQNFVSPVGLDLSEQAEQGDTILLAWDADHSLAKPMNQFSPRRLHRDTLLRLVVPKKS
jgi:hypothetical protein